MPYYLYKVVRQPILRLEKLEEHSVFKEASTRAKFLRRDLLALNEACEVKLIHADNELQAEYLLSQVRSHEPEPGDGDY